MVKTHYFGRRYELGRILSNDKDSFIGNNGVWEGGVWQWRFVWRRELYSWEKEDLTLMCRELENVTLRQDNQDKWTWKLSDSADYTIRSSYIFIQEKSSPANQEDLQIFKTLWNNNAPTKLAAHGWRILYEGIPIKVNIRRRGIIPENEEARCGLCGQHEETSDHLFFGCSISYKVWQECYAWFKINTVLPTNVTASLLQHSGLNAIRGNKKKDWISLWLIIMWEIWLRRNKVFFENERVCVSGLTERIRLHFCSLFKARHAGAVSSYASWVLNPWESFNEH